MVFFTEKEINFLKNYAPIYGAEQCAYILDRKIHRIYEKCSRLKVHSRILQKLTCDQLEKLKEQFKEHRISLDFSRNPKYLAYFLGYFWADGYILNNRNELRIEITQEDGLQVQNLFEKVGHFNLLFRERKNRKPQMLFQCTSKDVSSKLRSLGKYPHSLESHQKILEFIPKEYHIYFLRGLIDGDGCFYVTNKATQFSISNSYDFDWSYLVAYLQNNFNFNCKIQKRNNKEIASLIRNSNQHEIYNFVKQIYENTDNIWLDRKYKKVLLIYEKEHKYAENKKEV